MKLQHCAVLSKVAFWRWKLVQNTPATRKQKKTKKESEEMMGRPMSKVALAEFFEKNAMRLRKLKRKLKNSRKSFRRKMANEQFKFNEAQVYRAFSETIAGDPKNPRPKEPTSTKRSGTVEAPTVEEVEAFWRNMYERREYVTRRLTGSSSWRMNSRS